MLNHVMSTASECMLFAVLSTFTIAVIMKVVINKIVRSDETCSRTSSKSLKIPADCPKTGLDFIVDLECPDGTAVRVEIPIDPNSYEGRCSRVCDNDHRPVGLNLISPGHYT